MISRGKPAPGHTPASGRSARKRIYLGLAIVLSVLACVAVATLPSDMLAVQKMVTALALPCGLLWLVLIGMGLTALWRRQHRWFLTILAVWSAYTIAGNEHVSAYFVTRLECGYADIDPLAGEPCDAVAALGGATSTEPNGRPQLSLAGDRVALSARLYHHGLARCLVCTGEGMGKSGPNCMTARKKRLLSGRISECRPRRFPELAGATRARRCRSSPN